MQSINANTDKRRETPMDFTAIQLIEMNEAHLLRFVLAYHQYLNPTYKATQDIANVLDVEPQTLSNWLGGHGQPGYDQLLIILKHTKCNLVAEWINARKEKLCY